MDETLTFFPELFVDKMVKYWMNKHIKVLSQLSKVINGTNKIN